MGAYPFEFDIAASRGFRARQSGSASRGGFDELELPPRVTAVRGGKEIVPEPAKSVRAITGAQTTRVGDVLRRKAEKAVGSAPVVIAPEVIVESPAVLIAARKAELEREEAKAAEARKIAEAEAQLRTERAELIARVRMVDVEVFSLIWVGQSFVHEQIIAWIETIGLAEIRTVRWHLDDQTKMHAEAELARRAEEARREAEAAELRKEEERAKAADAKQARWAQEAEAQLRTERAEDDRKAAQERGRLAKPADPRDVVKLAGVSPPKQVKATKPGKKTAFNILGHLLASAGKPVVAAAPPPSAEELAEIERRVNGGSMPADNGARSWLSDPNRKKNEFELAREVERREQDEFADRIRGLDPRLVARLHRDGCGIRSTWTSPHRMLEVLYGKNRYFQTDMAKKMRPFLERCEQG